MDIDFADAYTTFHRDLHTYFERRTSPHDAEDLVADTFARALDAHRRGHPCHTHPRGWLFRIAHNLVVDHYKRRSRQPDRIPLGACTRFTWPDYADQTHRRTRDDQLRAALIHIPPDQRAVVSLLLDGYTYAEIARCLDKTVGAVKALRHRALDSLRPWLTPDEEIESRK